MHLVCIVGDKNALKPLYNRVFDKIFSLDQIGSGQAMGEPLYFQLLQPCLKIVTLFCFKCQHPLLHEQYWPMLFYCCANVAQVLSHYWAKEHLPAQFGVPYIGSYQKHCSTITHMLFRFTNFYIFLYLPAFRICLCFQEV